MVIFDVIADFNKAYQWKKAASPEKSGLLKFADPSGCA